MTPDREALERAARIIDWMVPHIGGMCPPDGGIFELNEHFIYMGRIGYKPALVKDGRPINQRPEPARPTTRG